MKAERDEAETKAEAAAIELGREIERHGNTRQVLTELEQEQHEFLQMSAVYLHSYKTDLMLDVVREKMGTLDYYKELLAAGCTPTKADLEMFIKEMENK